MAERVVLSVPAKAEYARTVRMTAASLFARHGASFDAVDDVRMAAEEAFVLACERPPASGALDVEFSVGDSFEMRVRPLGTSGSESDEEVAQRTEFATLVLQAVCDEFEIGTLGGEGFVRIVKSVSASEGSSD